MWAAITGHADVVQLLLSAGANMEAADNVIAIFVVLIIIFCRIEIAMKRTDGNM